MTEAVLDKAPADPVVVDAAPVDKAPPAKAVDSPPAADKAPPSDAPLAADKPAGDAPEAKDKAGIWPESWREEMADGDDDLQKEAARYGSPKGILKALKEAKALIRSGQLKKAAPDPKDEKATAEWRKEQGIPEAATDYKPPTIKGHEWTDEDKPVLATYFEMAHAKGLPQAVLDANLEIYAGIMRDTRERQAVVDKENEEASQDTLRKEWGPEYRGNWNLAQRFLDETPLGRKWADAVMPDGRLVGHVPEFIAWASDQARNRYGDAAFLEGDGKTSKGSSRLTEIREMQTKEPDKYWSKEIQAEELDLLSRESKSKSAKR